MKKTLFYVVLTMVFILTLPLTILLMVVNLYAWLFKLVASVPIAYVCKNEDTPKLYNLYTDFIDYLIESVGGI